MASDTPHPDPARRASVRSADDALLDNLHVEAATTTTDSIEFMAEIHDEFDAQPPPPKAEAQLYVNLTLIDSYIGLSCAAPVTPIFGSPTNDYVDADDNIEGLYNLVDADAVRNITLKL
jgi:hypothetical protein